MAHAVPTLSGFIGVVVPRSSKVAATAVESKAIISVDNYVPCP